MGLVSFLSPLRKEITSQISNCSMDRFCNVMPPKYAGKLIPTKLGSKCILYFDTRSFVKSENPSSALEITSRLVRMVSRVLLPNILILSTLLMISFDVSRDNLVMLLATSKFKFSE